MKNGFLKGMLSGMLIAFVVFAGAVGIRSCVGASDEVQKKNETTNKISVGTPSPTAVPSHTSTPTPVVFVSVTKGVTPTPTPISDPLSENVFADEMFLEKMELIEDLILDFYYKEVSAGELKEAAFAGAMNGIGDPYSRYYTAAEYAKEMESSSGVYCGIGAVVSQDRQSMVITVTEPYKTGPAYKAGMKVGDIIVGVDGVDIQGVSVDIVVTHLKGEEGTPVTVRVYRPSINDYVDIEIIRAKVEIPTVESEMKDGNIGYIRVSSFDEITTAQFIKAFDEIVEKKAEGLIIDLRSNPGGYLNVTCDMADYILPYGSLITYIQDKQGARETIYATNKHKNDDLPIVILVNEYSASASEVFTGALRDYKRATIIGKTSFGKGIVQRIFPINDGSAVKLTIAHYFTPNGECIHGEGITPDIFVENPTSEDEDGQLDTAIEYLKKHKGEQK